MIRLALARVLFALAARLERPAERRGSAVFVLDGAGFAHRPAKSGADLSDPADAWSAAFTLARRGERVFVLEGRLREVDK